MKQSEELISAEAPLAHDASDNPLTKGSSSPPNTHVSYAEPSSGPDRNQESVARNLEGSNYRPGEGSQPDERTHDPQGLAAPIFDTSNGIQEPTSIFNGVSETRVVTITTIDSEGSRTVTYAKQYNPAGATVLVGMGSTASIWRHPTRAGVVIKAPGTEPQNPMNEHKFSTEAKILEILGQHPRIVQYLGLLQPSDPTRGLCFKEAAHGDLQHYLNTHHSSIDDQTRLKWCREAAEALAHCHARKVLHCDLRPDNMLINADLELCLCDFGGSNCGEYDGGGLPDEGFFDPRSDAFDVTEATEIFGLGSSMYTIMAGHLPHGPSSLKQTQDQSSYAEVFERLALKGHFPDTANIEGADIIRDCWTQTIRSAEEAFLRYVEIENQRRMLGEARDTG